MIQERDESIQDLLYLRAQSAPEPGAESAILAILRERGWRYRIVSGEPASLDRNGQQFAVGLVELTAQEGALEPIWKSEMLGRASEWIALVPPDALESEAVRDFVGRFCFDYHTLPVEPSCLAPMLGHARGMAALRRFRDLDPLAGAEEKREPSGQPRMVGQSPAVARLQKLVRRVAQSDAPILISGETGTGKELTARAIHSASPRSQAPLVTVDCGVIPQELIYSELFGHERGAFTGATERRIGQVEKAEGGTLFLDEIGELPLSQQVHLLRLLQEGEIRRLGSGTARPVNVRILAASHVDLARAVREGRFREDLYYRLNVVPIQLPPLRERIEDIEPLAEYFFARCRQGPGCHARALGREACAALRAHPWPGNVRELQNRIQRAAILCDGPVIRAADLGLSLRTGMPPRSLMEARTAAEVSAIREALAWVGDSRTLAAQALGVSRVTLYRLMARHRIPERPPTDEGHAPQPSPEPLQDGFERHDFEQVNPYPSTFARR